MSIAVAVYLMAAAAQAPLEVHGQKLPNACVQGARLKVADPDARRLVSTLLCAPDSAANRRLAVSLLTPKARLHVSGTGEEDMVTPIDKDNILARGQAWGPQIDDSADQVKVSYYPNEACIHSRTLERIGGRWRLTQLGEACD